MRPLSKREKYLSASIFFLFLIITFLTFKIIDYKIDIFAIKGSEYSEPPSMIESIENASMIFLCKTEIEEDCAKYRINEILYKDADYEFPFKLGDFYPRLKQKIKKGNYYGEDQVVILSQKGPTVFQSLQIVNGSIPGFDGISVENFVEEAKTIRKR